MHAFSALKLLKYSRYFCLTLSLYRFFLRPVVSLCEELVGILTANFQVLGRFNLYILDAFAEQSVSLFGSKVRSQAGLFQSRVIST